MANSITKADSEVLDIVDSMVLNSAELPELCKVYDPQTVKNNESRIAFMFREEAAKSGGVPVLAKTGKVSPKVRPLLENPHIEVIVEIAYDQWVLLSDHQRRALLYHELSRIVITEDENNGTLKMSLRSPDISYFYDELHRFGDWRPRLVELEGGEMPANQACEDIERILGIKPPVTNVEQTTVDSEQEE